MDHFDGNTEKLSKTLLFLTIFKIFFFKYCSEILNNIRSEPDENISIAKQYSEYSVNIVRILQNRKLKLR